MYVKRTHEIKVLYILHKYKCYTLYNITHLYNVLCRLNKNRIDMIVLKWVRPCVKTVCNFSDRDIFLLTDHRRRRAAEIPCPGSASTAPWPQCYRFNYSQNKKRGIHKISPNKSINTISKNFLKTKKGDSVKTRLTEYMRYSKITGKTIS